MTFYCECQKGLLDKVGSLIKDMEVLELKMRALKEDRHVKLIRMSDRYNHLMMQFKWLKDDLLEFIDSETDATDETKTTED